MERSRILTAIVAMFVLNAAVMSLHYILIFAGVIPVSGDLTTVREFAVADFFIPIIPSIVGALGLWRFKAWGWTLAILASGGYLYGVSVLLTRSALTSGFTMMSAVSIYFVIFSLAFVAYLWRQRALFSW